MDSSDPVVSRTFDIPSWFTFRQLHYTVQYAMAWTVSHAHSFSCKKMSTGKTSRRALPARKELLKILSKEGLRYANYDDMYSLDDIPTEDEAQVKLSDVYDSDGRLRDVVSPNGVPPVLMYLYDFGV